MTGRVAVLKAYGSEFELREYPVPDPEPGAVVIRLTRAGLRQGDTAVIQGAGGLGLNDGLRISRAALSMAD